MSETPKIDAFFLITGEKPGSGQTTVAKYIAEKYGLPRHYAGLVRRSAAEALNLHLADDGDIHTFVELISENNPRMPIPLLHEGQFDERALVDFGVLVGKPENWQLLAAVEKLIDRSTALVLAKGKPGVGEGKLAVIADEIFPIPNALPIHTHRFLLEAPPIEVTAERVLERRIATGEVVVNSAAHRENLLIETAMLIQERDEQDWIRYSQTYGIDRSDLRRPEVIVVNTNRPLNQVLEHINEIMGCFSCQT